MHQVFEISKGQRRRVLVKMQQFEDWQWQAASPPF
jgi:hypothetical protein